MAILESLYPNLHYRNCMNRLENHINNLPMISWWDECDPDIASWENLEEDLGETINQLIETLLKHPKAEREFLKLKTQERLDKILKSFVIFIFMKQGIQINCVRFNRRNVFISLNNIFVKGANQDNYYRDRFLDITPSSVNHIYSAIQAFLKECFNNAGCLTFRKEKTALITTRNGSDIRKYEFIYRPNLFLKKGLMSVFETHYQKLIKLMKLIDQNNVINDTLEAPFLSGKCFYDLFFCAHLLLEFINAVISDHQQTSQLFKGCFVGRQLDSIKAVKYLASSVLPTHKHLFMLRELFNEGNEDTQQWDEKYIQDTLGKQVLKELPFSIFNKDAMSHFLKKRDWHDSWGTLNLMDLMILPSNLVGKIIKPSTPILLLEKMAEDTTMKVSLVFKPITSILTSEEQEFEPRLILEFKNKRKIYFFDKPIEMKLPPHLTLFFKKDLRKMFKYWVCLLLKFENKKNVESTLLSNFLKNLKVGEFFKTCVQNDELVSNFQRRIGFYLWSEIKDNAPSINPNVLDQARKYLIENMSLDV